MANEIVEEYGANKKQGLVFKIHLEKAYYHVEWDFLDFTLEMKGFGLRWRKWMLGCLFNASYSIFVNGRPREKFRGSRGLHQGYPLSLFLFAIVVDGLGSFIDKAKSCELLKGFVVGRDGVEVFHL